MKAFDPAEPRAVDFDSIREARYLLENEVALVIGGDFPSDFVRRLSDAGLGQLDCDALTVAVVDALDFARDLEVGRKEAKRMDALV